MRARQSPERGRQEFGAAARSRSEGYQPLDPRAARLWQAVQGKDRQLDVPDRAGAGTGRATACFSRAARCWADRVRSTACFMSAASTRITIAGVSAATPAGAMTTCCRISGRRRTSSAAPMNIMAPAARCRFPDWRHADPLSEAFVVAAARDRHAGQSRLQRRQPGRRRIFPDHDAARPARQHGGLLSAARQGPKQSAASRLPRWRSASCSRDAARGAVEYRQGGALRTARARKEILVSGGAYNSPQLLQLSGVGPAELCEAAWHRRGARCAGRRQRSAGSPAGQAGDAVLPAHHAQRYRQSSGPPDHGRRCNMRRSARGR